MEELLFQAARAGIQFRVDGNELRVTAPQGALTEDLRQGLRLHKNKILELLKGRRSADEPLPVITPDFANRSTPFPLTELQHAYWLGRESIMEMGDVATHLYVELDCVDLDVLRLNEALCRMIDRHDMLRATVNGDGLQQILSTVPRYEIAVVDRSHATDEECDETILSTRDALSHQVLKADRWPLFEVRATRLPRSRVRLYVSLDLLILDAWSIFLFFKEWHKFYKNADATVPELGISFRDYVVAEKRLQSSAAYQQAMSYWMKRVDALPPAPDLPLRTNPGQDAPRFSRREARLTKGKWEKLRAAARTHGLTPSALLLAAYSEVLARWSTSPHFTLNVTLSNRLPLHKDVNHLLGDFTSLIMQEVDRRNEHLTFLEFAQQQQKQFLTDLDHREFSGVNVLREWAKRRGGSLQATMPVVFSSGLIWSGDEAVGDIEEFGKKVYSVSQTSQVWLDHHVMEVDGELVYLWDAVDAVFPEGVLDAMFSSYCGIVERLVDDPTIWASKRVVPLPETMRQRTEIMNRTECPLTDHRLHAGFVDRARRSPESPAVLSSDRILTYGQLLNESCGVADWLLEHSLQPGEPVAVLMNKGWEQIVGVLGVLLAGGAYLPIDADLPQRRQLELLQIGETRHVLVQPGFARDALEQVEVETLEIQADLRGEFSQVHAALLERPRDELAYIIYTSGTTGTPKGVMIDHRGAVNTIEQVNRLFGVGAEDRVLGVSSLSFDLSVYDIFGLLAVGGALVLPDSKKGHDAAHWRELIARYGITFWNSAPQLMRMLMDSFSSAGAEPGSLRTVMLSGDFIPLDLPERIRSRYTQAQVISLGGATEASIWSIYHPVDRVESGWTSIPYGKPLPNQTIWVYDHAMRTCPDHVRGRIYIGGTGLAKGYWRDADKTAARFIYHPLSGERLYDTGDLGRYASDGNIFILGRDDGQIKIRGHRIELGEIETILRQHPKIKQVVVLATVASVENRQLVAYLELAVHRPSDASLAEMMTDNQAPSPPSTEEIKEFVSERLPDYMVPSHFVVLAHIPVSSNGKIDYRALPEVDWSTQLSGSQRVLPRDEIEQTIFAVWSRVISGCDIGVTDSFFELGGDSVLATQLVRDLNLALPFNIEMHELFENITIEALAVLFRRRAGGQTAETLAGSAGGPPMDLTTMLSDIQSAEDAFKALNFARRDGQLPSEPTAVLLTGGTGWIGAHVLAELLSLSSATVYCLVRASNETQGRRRLVNNLRRYGLEIAPFWSDRLRPVCGDLSLERMGLDQARWERLAEEVGSVYHLGASVNVLHDYAAHRAVNVTALQTIVRFASEHHAKPLFFTSPLAVCRRFLGNRLVVLPEESVSPVADGLLTGYSQSKWTAERILSCALDRGLRVKIYRTSHVLPSSANGSAKSNYTYDSVLKVALETGVIPDWENSSLSGTPVDAFSRLMVEDSLALDHHQGVVHIENRTPLSLKVVIELLLEAHLESGASAAFVSLEEWKNRCAETAARLPDKESALARILFANRSTGVAVENMFSHHPVHTRYYEERGRGASLSALTPPAYWKRMGQRTRSLAAAVC